jgi:hypothetical protein
MSFDSMFDSTGKANTNLLRKAINEYKELQIKAQKKKVKPQLLLKLKKHGLKGKVKDLRAKHDYSDFAGIAFPIVRRVYPNLIMQDIFKIQPLPISNALTYWYDEIESLRP